MVARNEGRGEHVETIFTLSQLNKEEKNQREKGTINTTCMFSLSSYTN